jgi:hypothetical protein
MNILSIFMDPVREEQSEVKSAERSHLSESDKKYEKAIDLLTRIRYNFTSGPHYSEPPVKEKNEIIE